MSAFTPGLVERLREKHSTMSDADAARIVAAKEADCARVGVRNPDALLTAAFARGAKQGPGMASESRDGSFVPTGGWDGDGAWVVGLDPRGALTLFVWDMVRLRRSEPGLAPDEFERMIGQSAFVSAFSEDFLESCRKVTDADFWPSVVVMRSAESRIKYGNRDRWGRTEEAA